MLLNCDRKEELVTMRGNSILNKRSLLCRLLLFLCIVKEGRIDISVVGWSPIEALIIGGGEGQLDTGRVFVSTDS